MLAPTLTVMFDDPFPGAAIGLGLKLTVVPFGTPLADRLTALLNPPLIAVVMVEDPCAPWSRLKAVGAAEIVKFAGAVTVNVTVVLALYFAPPHAPLTTMG